MKYKIFEHEINKTTTVEANGIAEAMLDFLPWPTLTIGICWVPSTGRIVVTDHKTDFMYTLEIV